MCKRDISSKRRRCQTCGDHTTSRPVSVTQLNGKIRQSAMLDFLNGSRGQVAPWCRDQDAATAIVADLTMLGTETATSCPATEFLHLTCESLVLCTWKSSPCTAEMPGWGVDRRTL